MALSAGVAATGIAAPIGLSFVLAPLAGASHLECFAAGAALCSTSLGTTFAVLRASGLGSTRLGVVLTSAAMLDDVVGLVMVQVISNLGSQPGTSISSATVIRPVFVSLGFAIAAAVACQFVARPVTILLNQWRIAHPGSALDRLLRRRETAITLQTALLISMVTGSSYAGTSNLFAAYIGGAAISWWDTQVPHPEAAAGQAQLVVSEDSGSSAAPAGQAQEGEAVSLPLASPSLTQLPRPSGIDVYQHYYHPAVKWVLQPMFFASIGFSIPITQMFRGSILWRGVIYAVLMLVGKLFCSLWLVRIPGFMVWVKSSVKGYRLEKRSAAKPSSGPSDADQTPDQEGRNTPSPGQNPPLVTVSTASNLEGAHRRNNKSAAPAETASRGEPLAEPQNSLPKPPKPLSLYPSAILGLAMVPRGEIGFLISAVAQSNGIFGGSSDSGGSDIFLMATWAIVLCTVIGPLCVGLLVRRVRRLEAAARASAGQG